LPAHARSVGSALLGIIDNLSLFISTKLVPTFHKLIGIHGAFLLYSCVCCMVLFICFFCMPDTSGLSLEEIEALYRNPKKDNKNLK
jgi:sugar phosphate permease